MRSSPDRSSRWASRKRKKNRGAAMVESLVLIPVLIILDLSLMYMHGIYDARLSSMRSARREAWSYALGSCQSSSSSTSSSETDSSLFALKGDLMPGMIAAKGSTLRAPFDTNLPVGAATASKGAGGISQISLFKGLTMTTENRVLCNEVQDDISEGDKRQTINSFYGQLL